MKVFDLAHGADRGGPCQESRLQSRSVLDGRLGLPLSIFVVVAGVPLIALVWPIAAR
jgi:hypothetical protein